MATEPGRPVTALRCRRFVSLISHKVFRIIAASRVETGIRVIPDREETERNGGAVRAREPPNRYSGLGLPTRMLGQAGRALATLPMYSSDLGQAFRRLVPDPLSPFFIATLFTGAYGKSTIFLTSILLVCTLLLRYGRKPLPKGRFLSLPPGSGSPPDRTLQNRNPHGALRPPI